MTAREEELKSIVRQKYGAIASATPAASSCCCGPSCCAPPAVPGLSEDYSGLPGYVPEADLSLGCGIPVDIAGIRPGDTVLDLGSGAGNDVFVARRIVGEAGRVIGVDMTAEMVARARANNARLGFANVEFRLGEIEQLPVESGSVDVVISNCVLNLVPGKRKAFAEIARVLKPGGRFSVSDIVLQGALPPPLLEAAALYAGCVSGALQKDRYLDLPVEVGLSQVSVRREKPYLLPDETLLEYLSPGQLSAFKASGSSILSITVTGEKPSGPAFVRAAFRHAIPSDDAAIRSLLEEAGLPTESIGTGRTFFSVALREGAVIAVAGLEFYGPDALLRSVAVSGKARGEGLGSSLLRFTETTAAERGIQRMVLLTETARPFFLHRGYRAIDRAMVCNPAMERSSEFSGICPSSSVCMVRELTARPSQQGGPAHRPSCC
jgi:SAM-dependent methyltransferase